MKNLSLYQITSSFTELMEHDEISEEDKANIEKELTELLQKKSNGIIGYTRNIELTINAMKEEEKRIADNRKILENRLKNFKDYVKDCMENSGISKIQTDLGTLSIAKSPISVEIIDESKIPDEFKEVVKTTKIDKKKITDEFKETGEIVDGVVMHTSNTSLRIK